MVLVHILIILISLLVLIKSADYFVDSASNIARYFGMSEFVIGLTLVAIGTSLPEFASSIVSSLNGHADLAIGNVVGSNIANILLVLGVAALFARMKTDREMLDRDGMVLVFISIAMYWLLVLAGFNIFVNSPLIIRIGGAVLILMFFVFLAYVAKIGKHMAKQQNFEEFMAYMLSARFMRLRGLFKSKKEIGVMHKEHKEHKLADKKRRKLWHSLIITVLSCAGVVISAKFFIGEALWIADIFNVSGGVVGMTLVALGTSLPELTVSIVGAKKGLGDLVIGNILGSNIANILFVGGTSLLIAPAILPKITLIYTIPFMVFTSVLLMVFIRTRWRIGRSEGFVFLMLYLLFLLLVYKGFLL